MTKKSNQTRQRNWTEKCAVLLFRATSPGAGFGGSGKKNLANFLKTEKKLLRTLLKSGLALWGVLHSDFPGDVGRASPFYNYQNVPVLPFGLKRTTYDTAVG